MTKREPVHVAITSPNGDLRTFDEIEIEVLRLALLLCDGNMIETARRLGIGRSTLYRKIVWFGIEPRHRANGELKEGS